MKKRLLVIFSFLFIFWMIISGVVNLQHIVVGLFLSLFTVWFWKDLNLRLPGVLYPKELMLFLRCIIMMIGYVIQSNIDVIKVMLFSDLSSDKPEGSMFLKLEPGIESDWGKVFLANCITITPGTITIDINPDTNIFTIHALTREMGESLSSWRMIDEIKNLETLVQRRKAHVVDNDRIHDSNSTSVHKSDNWTDRD